MTADVSETRSTCPYCGVGCGVLIEHRRDAHGGAQITGVRGDPEHPANFGRLCTKGSTLHLTAAASITRQARLLHPQRRVQRGGPLERLDWDAALDLAADRFASIVERDGPDAVGFYLSGQLLTEDYAVFNKLAKGLIGTHNVDTNSRLCMSSAVTGYKLTLGADAPPCSYEDLAQADTVFIAGSNMAWAHPILFRRLEDAKRARPALRVIVADPRRTETAEFADLHLPLRPGSDVALFHGLLHLLIADGRVDEAYIAAHTQGFEAVRQRVAACTPQRTAEACGLDEAALRQAADWFGQAGRPGGATLSLYCQGLNQSRSGAMKNAALIHLHLATGQIGRPGAGPFSLTGQPNAMGGREAGGMATLLPGHREIGHAAHRAEVERLWGLDRLGRRLPERPGLTAVELFEAAADGAVKALWIACTNPAQSMPDQATVRRALERAEFVVVQDAFATTATAAFADLLLPASSWGEKEGTVTNSERRISRVRAAVPAPGEARADWAIAVDLARRLEARWHPAAAAEGRSLFPYDGPEAVWNEHRETTRGRDLDIGGLSWARLDRGPVQWPCAVGADEGAVRLYADGRFPTPDGRARFVRTEAEPTAETCDERYPLALTTGRLRDQWHGMSRTGTLGRLYGHVAEPVVELHPDELARRGWRDGELLRWRSRRGEVVLPAQASDRIAVGQAYVAMHWGSEVLGGCARDGRPLAGINALTNSANCPQSRQPELKFSAVQAEPAGLPWRLVAMAWLPPETLHLRRAALVALMSAFGHAVCLPFGRDREGLMFRAAAAEPPPVALLEQVAAALDLDGPGLLRYADAARGQWRRVRREGRGDATRVAAFLLAGDTVAEPWLRTLLEDALPAGAHGRRLLMAQATPPVAQAPRGRQVCTCFDVAEPAIVQQLLQCNGTAAERLAQLQGALRCGTNCGSCLPELRRLERRHACNGATACAERS